jgi:hypothetical protein
MSESKSILFDMFYINKNNIEDAIRKISKLNKGELSILEQIEDQNRAVILFKDFEDCNMFKIQINKYIKQFN